MKPNVSKIKRSVDVPPINRIVKCGRMIRIMFHGVETIIPANAPGRFLYDLIEDGGKGLSDEALYNLIRYGQKGEISDNTTSQFCTQQKLSSTDLSGQVVELITAKQRKNERIKYVYIKNAIPELEKEIEPLEHELLELKEEQSMRLKRFELEIEKLFGSDFIYEFNNSRRAFNSHPELCRDDRELLQRILGKFEAKGRVLKSKFSTLQKQLEQKKHDLKQVRKTRTEAYRCGYISVPVGELFKVPVKSTKMGDYVRKLKTRILKYLQNKCYPRPEALIEEIEENIIRINGINQYVSEEEWEV